MMVALPNDHGTSHDPSHDLSSVLANLLGVDVAQFNDFGHPPTTQPKKHRPGDVHPEMPFLFPTNELLPSVEIGGVGHLNLHGHSLKHFNDDPKTVSSCGDVSYSQPNLPMSGFGYSPDLNLGSQDLDLGLSSKSYHSPTLSDLQCQTSGLSSNNQIHLTPAIQPEIVHPREHLPSLVESHHGLNHPVAPQVMNCSGALDSDSKNYAYVAPDGYVYTNRSNYTPVGYSSGQKLYIRNPSGPDAYDGYFGSDMRVYDSKDHCIGYVTPSGCGYLPNGQLYVQASKPLNAAFTMLYNLTSPA
jgi:hypothetical protein